MFRVEIVEGQGTGAPEFKYRTISGVGFSKSVKTAIRQAKRMIDARSEVGDMSFVPVLRQMSIYRGMKLIGRKIL